MEFLLLSLRIFMIDLMDQYTTDECIQIDGKSEYAFSYDLDNDLIFDPVKMMLIYGISSPVSPHIAVLLLSCSVLRYLLCLFYCIHYPNPPVLENR